MNRIFKNISTLGPIGYLPAPGTWASFATLICVYFLHVLNVSHVMYALLLVVFTVVAWYAVVHTIDFFRSHDPSEIVVDEAVGCMVTFFMIPITGKSMLVGFLLFRLFDIAKPFGLKKLEKMGGAWGILLDDIGAGVLSNVILNMLLFFSII